MHGVDLDGLSPGQMAALRRTQVGYVFQRLNLVPSLTALENVMLPLELDGMSRRLARAEAEAALGAAGLAGPWDRYPDDFSGGQQQRIAIAGPLSAAGRSSSPTSQRGRWTPSTPSSSSSC